MTTIGIIGMGKMGQAISAVLETRKELKYHQFSRISSDNEGLLKTCNVVIEFTTPDAAPGIIKQCLDLKIPVVSGTTGWHEYHLDSILSICKQQHSTFLYATNFSIGMNITFALNQKLAEVMQGLPQFKPALKEIHHIHKKDSPSGTAYTMMEDILSRHPQYTGFALTEDDTPVAPNLLPVTAIREGDIKGYHQVSWNSGLEQIIIAHEAFDRRIFAEGAVVAALWLASKSAGIYRMSDVLQL